MSRRKFFESKITELEDLFNARGDDFAILEELEEELERRSTEKARILLQKVKISLQGGKINFSEKKEFQSDKKRDEIGFPDQIIPDIDWNLISEENEEAVEPGTELKPRKTFSNDPIDIIDTWTVLECLSPQSYKKPKDLIVGKGNVTELLPGKEPWTKKEKIPHGDELYYFVFLGAIKMEQATKRILEYYQDKRIESRKIDGLSSLGVIILNREGVPLPVSDVAISSFGWAYPRAISGKLDELKLWLEAEKALKNGLRRFFYREDEDGVSLPLSYRQIIQAHEWLLRNCEIPLKDAEPPHFVVRHYRRRTKGEPESPLLNSFFIDDLRLAKSALKNDKTGKAFEQYLCTEKKGCDILKDKHYIKEALQPKNTPEGRWPGNGRFPLVLLQQTAVNLAFNTLKDSGLFSVNGPPGTGKTTLLRDIIAGVLVKRAKALYGFVDPNDAFKYSGKMKLANSFVHFYKIDNSLRGHEIVVASSNNKAVENVSRELPLRSQIAEDLSEFSYFHTTSDALLGEEGETWGLIASVLGNARNRGEFVNKAWWEKDTGLKDYLRCISGFFDRNKETEIPKIIRECDPPNDLADAGKRWRKAREKFADALKKSQDIISATQDIYETYEVVIELRKKLHLNDNKKKEIQDKIDILTYDLKLAEDNLSVAETALETKLCLVDDSNELKPGILKRFFRRNEWKGWKSKHQRLLKEKLEARELLSDRKVKCGEITAELQACQEKLSILSLEQQRFGERIDKLLQLIDRESSVDVKYLVTDSLWDLPHQDQQNFTPDFPPEAHRLRDDVFVSAIELHKAFIDASAKQIRNNLSAFIGCLSGYNLSQNDLELLPHLWSSFFILSPVVSTTFASVGRMLKNMPHESIGWLLIDEAGQATPQAAVGAIYRARRVIAVGDPLQIEPVVTMPPELVDNFSEHFYVDPVLWTAPSGSVQTLADHANKYGANIPRDIDEIRIGTPLLVHRRCEEPMFSISNELAYAGLMVHATIAKSSEMKEIVGKSQWFDIQGSGDDKWCKEGGKFVVQLIRTVIERMESEPDIFVITPFKIVAQKMRDLIRNESELFKFSNTTEVNTWINEHIGTVHTFQGKEAQSVILLLGAPNPEQIGARNWAASNVNLLNVAVSRAKQNFYIVGNKRLWGNLGHMRIFTEFLN